MDKQNNFIHNIDFSLCSKIALVQLNESRQPKKPPMFCFKFKQFEALKYGYFNFDQLVILSTGFGKTIIFEAMVLMLEARDRKRKKVLIISPLDSIINQFIIDHPHDAILADCK